MWYSRSWLAVLSGHASQSSVSCLLLRFISCCGSSEWSSPLAGYYGSTFWGFRSSSSSWAPLWCSFLSEDWSMWACREWAFTAFDSAWVSASCRWCWSPWALCHLSTQLALISLIFGFHFLRKSLSRWTDLLGCRPRSLVITQYWIARLDFNCFEAFRFLIGCVVNGFPKKWKKRVKICEVKKDCTINCLFRVFLTSYCSSISCSPSSSSDASLSSSSLSSSDQGSSGS